MTTNIIYLDLLGRPCKYVIPPAARGQLKKNLVGLYRSLEELRSAKIAELEVEIAKWRGLTEEDVESLNDEED